MFELMEKIRAPFQKINLALWELVILVLQVNRVMVFSHSMSLSKDSFVLAQGAVW